MKRLIVSFSTVLMICAGIMLTSCKEDDEPLRLEVAPGDLAQNFDMSEGSKSVTVTANVLFTASVEQTGNWCTATASSSAVNITVTANTGESRTAKVTLSAKDVPNVVITVTQDAKPPFLTVEEDQKTQQFTEAAGEKTVAVSTNVQFTATVEQAAADWCTAVADNGAGNVKITVIANTGASRTAKVTVSATTVSDVEITVTQDATSAPMPGVLDNCESIDGWELFDGASYNPDLVSLDNDSKEGKYSVSASYGPGLFAMRKVFDTPVNTEVTMENGCLALWMYVSDVSLFGAGAGCELEISSSGMPDVEELSWSLPDLNLVNGWNEVELRLSSAIPAGSINLDAVNWFRFFHTDVTGNITIKFDHIRFYAKETEPPTPGVLDRCESTAGWKGDPSVSFSLDGADKKEGNYSLKIEADGSGMANFYKEYDPFNVEGDPDKVYLAFDLYVSDISMLAYIRMDLSSSGDNDYSAMIWRFDGPVESLNLVNGWNEIELLLNSGTMEDTENPFDQTAVNYFRFVEIYPKGPLVFKLDHIRFYSK